MSLVNQDLHHDPATAADPETNAVRLFHSDDVAAPAASMLQRDHRAELERIGRIAQQAEAQVSGLKRQLEETEDENRKLKQLQERAKTAYSAEAETRVAQLEHKMHQSWLPS